MSVFNPVWRVIIGGTTFTNYALANLTITTGRTNIYEQANAGYVNLELINPNSEWDVEDSDEIDDENNRR